MTDIIADFFKPAQNRADYILAARESAFQTAARKKRTGQQDAKELEKLVSQEFAPVLEAIKSLPPAADGTAFAVGTTKDTRSGVPGVTVSVSYGASDTSSYYDWLVEQPAVALTFTLKNGKIDAVATYEYQLAGNDMDRYYPTKQLGSFAEARKELGLAIAAFAPERVADIGRAIEKQSRPVFKWPQFK